MKLKIWNVFNYPLFIRRCNCMKNIKQLPMFIPLIRCNFCSHLCFIKSIFAYAKSALGSF
ncbi:hypothetical protein BBOV_III003765 [Babesia bovis T2Bo]|uniref:Uncharacterized protein n=1 Tax=Babesia bovis TaxID=5865 RepID=S6AZS2_BABBO|nr:hypothetical protein BBOV_III003765 [Babesia bovis T2Bo]KAG6440071.1 hypothetical protein BBOV_III003765 [Babesia bovis T2Bo]BAN64553.1 hypothetical protein [Babesia bovis]